MTAKWGKASIMCFVVGMIVAVFMAFIITKREMYLDANCPICKGQCMDSLSFGPMFNFLLYVFYLSPLNLLGAVLAFISIRKKEPAKNYARIGIAVNLPVAVTSVLLFTAILTRF